MASQFTEYFEEGRAAYDADRDREAALLYARAKEVAQVSGDKALAFQAGFWEASARHMLDENRLAYALLFALLADAPEDAPMLERWNAETLAYELWRLLGRRSRAEQTARLKGLESFASSHPNVPPSDLPQFRARQAEDSADWAGALRWYEQAWTAFDEQNPGYNKSGKAYGAVEALLRLGRDAEAARWLELLGQTDQERAIGRLCLHLGQALLALFRGGPRTAWDAARRALEDDLVGTQSVWNSSARHFLARLVLLIRPDDDPEDRFHPARALLRQKPESKRYWGRLSTVADFRLASVRFAAGVPSCDDYYYRQPQTLPAHINPPDPVDFTRRVQRARLALAHLQRKSDLLDRQYECVWHGDEARARMQHLEEILQAVL